MQCFADINSRFSCLRQTDVYREPPPVIVNGANWWGFRWGDHPVSPPGILIDDSSSRPDLRWLCGQNNPDNFIWHPAIYNTYKVAFPCSLCPIRGSSGTFLLHHGKVLAVQRPSVALALCSMVVYPSLTCGSPVHMRHIWMDEFIHKYLDGQGLSNRAHSTTLIGIVGVLDGVGCAQLNRHWPINRSRKTDKWNVRCIWQSKVV